MSTDTLKKFTDDELALLLYAVNSHKPPILNCEVTPHLLKSIHLWKLEEVLKKSQPNLTEEGKPIFSCVIEKLGIKSP